MNDPARLHRWIQNHPALSFIVLVVLWSNLYWIFLFSALPLDPETGPTPLHILLAGLGGSPSLFGFLLAYLTGGQKGLLMLLMHFSLTGSLFVFGPPAAAGSLETLRFHLIAIGVYWLAAGVVAAAVRLPAAGRLPSSGAPRRS